MEPRAHRSNGIGILPGASRPTGASAAVQGDRPTIGAGAGDEAYRADQGVRPTTSAAFPILGRVCGIMEKCVRHISLDRFYISIMIELWNRQPAMPTCSPPWGPSRASASCN